MSEPRPNPLGEQLRQPGTRRRLIISAGAGAATILFGGSILARSDDKHDDADHNDDHGDDHDGDVKPVGTVPADSAEVRIDDDDADGFTPGTITINVGDSVTWVNVDDEPHTATGEDFNTGKIDPGAQATVVFNEAGSFFYVCGYHPVMTGTVEVRDESGKVPSEAAASPQASPAASPAPAQQAEVSIIDIAFDPISLEVTVGTTVTWTNDEDIPHTVTATDESFRSETLQLGDTFRHTFSEAGEFDYFCEVHPNMDAKIIVSG